MIVAFVMAVEPLRSVQGIVMSKADLFRVGTSEPDASITSANQGKADGFLKILKAPFKSISGLFGRGKKDDNKLHRLSEKDVERFEGGRVVQINDAASVPGNEPSNSNMSGMDHLERGRSLLDGDNINDAIFELSLAASIDPKLTEAHTLLGVAYGRKGFSELAHKSFEAALKLDRKNAQILNNLGYLLISEGDYKRAADRLKKAAQIAPNDPRILNNLALAQAQLGKFEDAYQNFVRAGGEVNARLNIANQLELAGRSDEAQKHYEAARLRADADQKNDQSQSIEVLMQIKNGLVIYASIAHPRPGFATYEASALRIARKRRYPVERNGRESLIVKIMPYPNS
jgi:Flp pilus assembly protein TadD